MITNWAKIHDHTQTVLAYIQSKIRYKPTKQASCFQTITAPVMSKNIIIIGGRGRVRRLSFIQCIQLMIEMLPENRLHPVSDASYRPSTP
jgi:hypothetical protein